MAIRAPDGAKNTIIGDGGSTALYATYTVDTVYTVYTVDTVDAINAVDIVDTVDIIYTVYRVYIVEKPNAVTRMDGRGWTGRIIPFRLL